MFARSLTLCNPLAWQHMRLLGQPSSVFAAATHMRLFGTLQHQVYGTDTPAKSNRYQRGLYHMKTHGQRRQRCFSMKYSIQRMKPNVNRKRLHSDILGMSFQVWISTKARKCIIKAGSLDKYLQTTRAEHIDTRFGLYLKDLIRKKTKDSNFEVPYIPGQADLKRTRKTQNWQYRNMPAVYMPTHVRMRDHSEFYIKTPQEMSRYEIAELERELKTLEEDDAYEPDFSDEEGLAADTPFKDEEEDEDEDMVHYPDDIDIEAVPSLEEREKIREYFLIKNQFRALAPIRLGTIKRFYDKFKMQKRKREELIAACEESEHMMQKWLGDEHVHWQDAIPGCREFLLQLEQKEAIKQEDKSVREGTAIGKKLLHVKTFTGDTKQMRDQTTRRQE